MDTENLLEWQVKPTKAVVFLVERFDRGVVGFLPPWEAQTSLPIFESQCLTQEIYNIIHTYWSSESGLCSMSLIVLYQFMGHSVA